MVTWSRFPIELPTTIHPFILKSYMPHFQLPTSLATVTSTSLLPPLSPLYRLGYNFPYISTNFFWSKSPTRLLEPLLDCWLARKDYLQISAFPDLVVVEREEVPYALQKKATGGATIEVVRSRLAGRSRPDFRGRQHQLLPPSFCDGGPSWVEGLDITLDNPADGFWWMVGCKYVIYQWMRFCFGPLGLQKG